MARPERRRRRRRPAAGLALALALAASSACSCAGAEALAGGADTAATRLFGWSDSRRSERLRCPDAVSAAVDAALVGPRGEATRAATWLARCREDSPFQLSATPMDAEGVREVCAASACVEWFSAVKDAQLPACDYQGLVDLRALAETFLTVCDDLGTGNEAETPDADTFAPVNRLHGRLETTQDATTTARRQLQESSEQDSSTESESSSASASASSSSSSSGGGGTGSSLQELGTGIAIVGYEAAASTQQSSAAQLAMSYLYICLVLALFNCSYLFFMRKT